MASAMPFCNFSIHPIHKSGSIPVYVRTVRHYKNRTRKREQGRHPQRRHIDHLIDRQVFDFIPGRKVYLGYPAENFCFNFMPQPIDPIRQRAEHNYRETIDQ
jgi:hypothetical protein